MWKKHSTATDLPDKQLVADCGKRFAKLNQLQHTIMRAMPTSILDNWITVLYFGHFYELVSVIVINCRRHRYVATDLPEKQLIADYGNWSAELNQLQRPFYVRWRLLVSRNQISRITILWILGNSFKLDCPSTSVSGNRCAGKATDLQVVKSVAFSLVWSGVYCKWNSTHSWGQHKFASDCSWFRNVFIH